MKLMKNKILILGGGGFIGSNLTKKLLQHENNQVTIADYSYPRAHNDYYLGVHSKLELDLCSPKAFDVLEADYDYVYLLASIVGVNNTINNPYSVIEKNTKIILNTLDWVKKSRIGKILFTSTSETYSASTEHKAFKIPTDERVPLSIYDISSPRFTYAVTKIFGESAFLNFSSEFDTKKTIVRYHNVYGPDMGFKHVIPHLAQRFISKESPFEIFGGNQTRSFCYIDDAVQGTILAMESQEANNEIFHIGNSVETSIENLIKVTANYFGYGGDFFDSDPYPGSVDRRCPNISKAKNILGYQPIFSLEDGLNKTLDWYNKYFQENERPSSDGFLSPKELKNDSVN